MLTSAEAILLDVFDLQEQDRIATFLVAEKGKVRGVAQGARRKYSRFAGALQPLAKAKITWFQKEGRDLARISSVDLIRPAHRLQGDLEGILLGGYLAGHVLEFAQENEPSDAMYRLLDSTLDALISGGDRGLLARYFEAWILRLNGIFPVPATCPECGRVFDEGGATLPGPADALHCPTCAPRGYDVSRSTLDFLIAIGRVKPENLETIRPSEHVLEQVEEVCGRVRRSFLGHELKSYRVMQETLATCGPSKN